MELDAALLAILAAVVGVIVAVVRQAFPKVSTRFLPLLAVAFGCAIGAGWTYLGAEVPEGVNKIAYLVLHGFFAGATASGVYSGGKAVAGK